MVSQVVQVALLGIGAFLIAVATVAFARRPVAMVYVLLGVYAWSLIGVVPSTRVMGIGVSLLDIANAVAFAAALVRMRRGPTAWQWTFLIVILLIAYGALRGAIQLGDSALLGFRSELFFITPALFVSTIQSAQLRGIVRGVVTFGLGLSVIALVRWLLIAAGVNLGTVADFGIYTVARVINAPATLWVGVSLVFWVVALFHRAPDTRTHALLASSSLALLVVLLAQHRTVWVATMIMLAVALVMARRHWLTKAAIVVVTLLGVLSIETSDISDAGVVAESLVIAASDTRTWEWRLDRWANVWSTHTDRGAQAIILGSGYGYGWVTGVVGEWEYSPHNGFIQVAVRLGLLGALLVFLPYAVAMWRLTSVSDSTARAIWLWNIGALVYYIPYSGTMLTGVLLGTAVVAMRFATARQEAVRGSHIRRSATALEVGR